MSPGHGQFEAGYRLPERLNARQVRRACAWLQFMLLAAVGISSLGCAKFPAIDPNGQCIFLPKPASTELRVPHIHSKPGQAGILPNEAYPTPAPPPPCLDGSCPEEHGIHNLFKHKKNLHSHFSHTKPGNCGEIQLYPMRVVAPVGGEVLLLAGICGKDGYLLKREPLEWMLSPDSVGQFIEVGDDTKGKLCSPLHSKSKVEKLDVDYARGRTGAKTTTITRGTPGCDDDVVVKDGQTWLTISSPSEGVSRVTVLAPESELWDRRRQTAIIYWVDSQASFPEPQVLRAPGPAQLVTRVTRAENFVPAEGWRVRYTMINPGVANFLTVGPTGAAETVQATSFVATVDSNGQAAVSVAAAPGSRGSTPIHIEVIRPAQPAQSLPELVLHQGATAVTFSSPSLEVQSSGPEFASVGDIITYTAVMGNPGDVDAENTRLVARLPAGTELVEAIPQPTETVPNAVAWVQGILRAGEALEIRRLALRVTAPQEMAVLFEATGATNLVARSSVKTQVMAPSVQLQFQPTNGKAQAEVGDVVYYDVACTNNGQQTLVNLELEIEAQPGLQIEGQSSSKVTQVIPLLQPQATERRPVAFRVMQEGQLRAVLRARSAGAGQVLKTADTSILSTPRGPRQPKLEAAIQFPPQIMVSDSQQSMAVITVSNTGQTPLSGINVDISYDPPLEARAIDQDNAGRVRTESGRLRWGPPDLQPQQVVQIVLGFVGKAPSARAAITVNATSGAVNASPAQAVVQILSSSDASGRASAPAAVAPPTSGAAAPPEQPRTGQWAISIIDLHDPITVGEEARYNVVVVNNQNQPDRNVLVQLGIPQGVSLRSVSGDNGPLQPTYAASSDTWDLPPVNYVRPGEQLRYTFVIVPALPQQLRLSARVSSAGQPSPQQAFEPVTVNAR